jgi:hypothetical protein
VVDKPMVPSHSFAEAALTGYLKDNAVSELIIVEHEPGAYRLEALLAWRTGRSVLVAARGATRLWRSLDTLRRFFAAIGVGKTSIRMELLE